MKKSNPLEGFCSFQQRSSENEYKISKMADQSRVASFFSYPYPSEVSAFVLAEAGFSYEGNTDEVICHHCGLKYSGWQNGDDPKCIHLEKSPDCLFFKCESEVYGDSSEKEVMSGACGGTTDMLVERRTEDKEEQHVSLKESSKTEESSVSVSTTQNQIGNIDHLNKPDSSIQEDNRTHVLSQAGTTNTSNGRETEVDQNRTENSSRPEDTSSQSDETQTVESSVQNSIGNLSNTSPDSSNDSLALTSTGPLETVPPKYQQFSVLATRLNSYRHWPQHLKQRPEDLAKAGLFYEGKNDYVRCFHCAGGLREWDPEDDPFYEHARWFPLCTFMRLMKGDKYIAGVQSGRIKPPEAQRDDTRQETDIFDHPAVISVMELGYNKVLLAKAITLYRKRHGTDLSAEKLLPIVWEIEENGDNDAIPEEDATETTTETDNIVKENECESTCDNTERECESTCDNTERECESTCDNTERQCESTCDNTERTYKEDITHSNDIDELAEENRKLREEKRCKVCLDEEASIVFLPCGHLVTCPMCASALRKCPVCRTYIRGTVKAIIS